MKAWTIQVKAEETEPRIALRRLRWKYEERVRLAICSEKVRVLSRTTPRSRTLEWKVKDGNLSARRGKSSLRSCWRVPNQMSCVLFGFSESRLEDIQRCKSLERASMRPERAS